jgi:putative ABC transport system ATP-binding protein
MSLSREARRPLRGEEVPESTAPPPAAPVHPEPAPPPRDDREASRAAMLRAAVLRQVVVRSQDVKKVYRMGAEEVHALRGVNLEIYQGEYLSIMGPSGSGKTTFFNMIGGLHKPTSGKVFIDEVDIAALDPFELAWLRCRKIGYIFQSFNIIPVMSALENVTLPMVFAGLSSDEARDKGVGLLKLVGLGDRVNHKPYELSGGQQQRVAIARSLANDPAIVLADEPTGNLDLKTGAEIIDLLTRLKSERGVTIITATHDHKMLAASDRVVWIRDGRIEKIELRENLKIEVGTIDGHAVS